MSKVYKNKADKEFEKLSVEAHIHRDVKGWAERNGLHMYEAVEYAWKKFINEPSRVGAFDPQTWDHDELEDAAFVVAAKRMNAEELESGRHILIETILKLIPLAKEKEGELMRRLKRK
jgi:hypothetical protein